MTGPVFDSPRASSHAATRAIGVVGAGAGAGAGATGAPPMVLGNALGPCSRPPCARCAVRVIQAGIKRVVCDQPDFDHQRWGEAAKIADTLFREAGLVVNYRQVGEEPTE